MEDALPWFFFFWEKQRRKLLIGFTSGVCCVVRFWVIFSFTLHLIFVVTYAVWYNLEFSQNNNRTVPHFCSYMCGAVYKIQFEAGIFSNFGLFLLNPKLIFPCVLGQVLNYWVSFSLFWVDFLNKHFLGLLNFFFEN